MLLYDYQLDAVRRMKNGCILCGDVGSGKSRTALAYFYAQNGGDLESDEYVPMDDIDIKDLYIITTARKRDTKEWEGELSPFLLSTHDDVNLYSNKVVVDSWNNIMKYKNVKDSFFIFDEQRVVGSGVWVKSFLKIAKSNEWILLSATPGDTWLDYIPVFIANGFYRHSSEFKREHVIYKPYSKFPQIDHYINTGRLIKLRNQILVNMAFHRSTISHHEDIYAGYDTLIFKDIMKTRWNIWENKPIKNVSEYYYAIRKVVNTSTERQVVLMELLEDHPKAIIFYNFDYELELLRELVRTDGTDVAEWNGHLHQPIPTGEKWVYLVQYSAGAEGWNCITTDTIIFWSQNYSYRITKQASGRIDRLNTPFHDLYYYHLKSHSWIDLAISKALREKRDFNEREDDSKRRKV